MTQKLQPVRGTHDILPDEAARREALVAMVARVFGWYGYGKIDTPIFEFSEVFHRTLGDTSDVVAKETYTFTDRGGESLTLRPEFTASVVRAFISNGLQETLPFKVYYHGPAFRYERPQKGRLRQFHQIGAELLGAADPISDAEMITMAAHALKELGLSAHVKLELNSLGDKESRAAYRSALVAYLEQHKESLSDDSKTRLEKNPLRVLDSKAEQDKAIVVGAPKLTDYFTPEAADFFAKLTGYLDVLDVKYTLNPKLVRGLDYYNHTVFEFTTESLGAQGTVLAGGRYDGLVALMGGQDIAGVGFAAGIERLLALMEVAGGFAFPLKTAPVAVIPVDTPQENAALTLTQRLREAGITVELLTRGNMGKKMKRAEKMGAQQVVILGEEEVATGNYTVKNMQSGEQGKVAMQEIATRLFEH